MCVDDFSNYFMVEPIKDKKAMTTLFNAFVKIVRREWALPTIVYCDKGSEFDNKIFNNKMKLGFRVQFTTDRRKAVYAERAIRTVRRALEQYYAWRPNKKPHEYKDVIQKIVNSHNNAPSTCAPKMEDDINASPEEIIRNDSLIDKMENILKSRRLNQYASNIRKKIISKQPRFKTGDIVRYYLRKRKFAKEAGFMGSWSKTMYKIQPINSNQCTPTCWQNWEKTHPLTTYLQYKKAT